MEERHPAAPRLGRGEPPMHAGLSPTFCGQPLVLDPASSRASTSPSSARRSTTAPRTARAPASARARSAPGTTRAATAARTCAPGIDPFAVLDVVDHGDAEPAPGDLIRSHEQLAGVLRGVLAAGAMPLVLGGDHSLSLPTLRVLAERFGADGYAVVHFDTHADTGAELYGVRISHGTPFRVAVEEGALLGANIVQIGLRGTWPGPEDFAWMRGAGLPLAHDGRDRRARARRRRSPTRSPTSPPGRRASTSPSTSTCSTPPSRPAPARPSRAASRRASCAPRSGASAGRSSCAPPTSSRSARRSTRAGITALAGERAALDILTGMAMRRRA